MRDERSAPARDSVEMGGPTGSPDEDEGGGWVEIDPSRIPRFPAEHPGDRPIWIWVLVLEARGIPALARQKGEGWQLRVPSDEFARAAAEISAYEEENRDWPPAPVHPPLADNIFTSLCILALTGLFHNLTVLGIFGLNHREWVLLGGAEAGKILAGEAWRTITALTLHADGEHLLANLLIGGFVVVRLCRETGTAVGWALLLLAGAGGNFLNAMLQDPGHLAVGASTAIFGAIGLQAGFSTRRHRRIPMRRWLLPLAAAVALLALLGTGGENTDLGAHFFGFLAGLLLGLGFRGGRPPLSLPLRMAAGATAALAPALGWLAALAGAP